MIKKSTVLIYFAAEVENRSLLVDRVVGAVQLIVVVGTKMCAKKTQPCIYGQPKTI